MTDVHSLFVVATPIGNLEDITLRALRVLNEVELIVAEDTRVTRKLLNYYHIKTSLISFHEHSGRRKLETILRRLQNEDLALVTDAGTPLISDPGIDLVKGAVDMGMPVVAVPGPSAVTAAVSISGFGTRPFIFLGFVPPRGSKRQQFLSSLNHESGTIIMFESPHRLRKTLKDLQVVLADRNIAISRELTKIHEEVFRGSFAGALDYFREPKGEFTIVIAGMIQPAETRGDPGEVIKELELLHSKGFSAREAIAMVVSTMDVNRREAYRLWLAIAPQR